MSTSSIRNSDEGSLLIPPKRSGLASPVHRIQQLVYDKAIVAPIYEVTGLNGVGPRVAEAGLGLIAGYAFSAPYEDVKLKSK